MAGFESCTSSAGETLNPHDSIIEDSQNQIGKLNESILIDSDVFDSLFRDFDDAFTGREFDSHNDVIDFLFEITQVFLWVNGFSFNDTDTIEEIDVIFKINGIAPMLSSTAVLQNDQGKYILAGSISKLTCNRSINPVNFTPQNIFPFNTEVSVHMYGEILYNFQNGSNKYGSFQHSSKRIHIMNGVILQEHDQETDEEQLAYVDVVLANELGHLQFHDIVVPEYGITTENLFEYGGIEYTFQHVDELWSDYSSVLKAYNISKESGNWDVISFELTRIVGRTEGWTQYNLTRSIFKEILDQELEWGDFFQKLESDIIAILESTKI